MVGGKTPEEIATLAPQLKDTQPFGRTDTPIAGPFDGSQLVRAAFEMTTDKSNLEDIFLELTSSEPGES